jgi:CRISPR-associated Csx2 family protein
MTTLVTFLGRSPKDESGYRKTAYRFPDGETQEPSAFFGWPLARRLRPERLVVLGTAGSMWDHLFEADFAAGSEHEEVLIALMQAVEDRVVTPALLAPLEPLLARRLDAEVRLVLIPYAREDQEQVELLRILDAHVARGEVLDLDVTHAFRHLPMIALMGALYLGKVKGVRIRHIWYGAYDPDTGLAPVHDLAGLIRVADWVGAFSAYDQGGDYGVFAELLPQALSGPLAEAAFLESVNRVGEAKGKAKQALAALREPSPDPAAALCYPALQERLAWAAESDFYQRQRALAWQYLAHGRLREAALHGYEAFVTGLAREQGLARDQRDARERAARTFDEAERQYSPRRERYTAWDSLRRLRNAVAHGSPPKGGEVQAALASRQAMHELLRALFNSLLDEPG